MPGEKFGKMRKSGGKFVKIMMAANGLSHFNPQKCIV
jgi:hypothetical protein